MGMKQNGNETDGLEVRKETEVWRLGKKQVWRSGRKLIEVWRLGKKQRFGGQERNRGLEVRKETEVWRLGKKQRFGG